MIVTHENPKRELTGTFRMSIENHISWCHFIEEMESPVGDQLAKQAITHKTYPAKLYFTPETMGDSCIRWIASDSQDRCWLSTNYNPRPQRWERRRYQVSEAWPMISFMNSTQHLAEPKSSKSQVLCSNGSWCLLVSNCSDNNSTTNILDHPRSLASKWTWSWGSKDQLRVIHNAGSRDSGSTRS